MKVICAMAMAVVAAAGDAAGESAPERERVVAVCVHQGNTGNHVVVPAQKLASRIFAEIGVRVEWHSRGTCPPSVSVIQISFSEQTPKLLPDALAYAHPYGANHIVVFSDRVGSRPVPQLLAYVLVHEITHILQGINRHSASGVMKASWDTGDYFEMARGRLRLSQFDIEMIYAGMDKRAAQRARAPVTAWR